MKNRQRILALDYGTKRIGLAISDELCILARPIGVIDRSERSVNELISLVDRENVAEVIIGLPKTMSGEDSEMTKEVRGFAKQLFDQLDKLEVSHRFYDERFSSILAAANIREQGLSKSKRKEKYRHDEEAARIILQEYLDIRK